MTELCFSLVSFLLVIPAPSTRAGEDGAAGKMILSISENDLILPDNVARRSNVVFQGSNAWKDSGDQADPKRYHFVHFDCNGVLMNGDAAKDFDLQWWDGVDARSQVQKTSLSGDVDFFNAGGKALQMIQKVSKQSETFDIKPIIRTFGNDMPDMIAFFQNWEGLQVHVDEKSRVQKLQVYWQKSTLKGDQYMKFFKKQLSEEQGLALHGTHLTVIEGWNGDDKVEVCRDKSDKVLTLDDLLLSQSKVVESLPSDGTTHVTTMHKILHEKCTCFARFLEPAYPSCGEDKPGSVGQLVEDIVVRLTLKETQNVLNNPNLTKKKISLMTPEFGLSLSSNLSHSARKEVKASKAESFLNACRAKDVDVCDPNTKYHDNYGYPLDIPGGCQLQIDLVKKLRPWDTWGFCDALFSFLWAKAEAQANMAREMRSSMETPVTYSRVSASGTGVGSLVDIFNRLYNEGPHVPAFVRDDAGFKSKFSYNKIPKLPGQREMYHDPKKIRTELTELEVFEFRVFHGNGKPIVPRKYGETFGFADAFFDDNVFNGIVTAIDPSGDSSAGKRLFEEPAYQFTLSPVTDDVLPDLKGSMTSLDQSLTKGDDDTRKKEVDNMLNNEAVSFPGSVLDTKFKINPVTMLQNGRPNPLLQVPAPRLRRGSKDTIPSVRIAHNPTDEIKPVHPAVNENYYILYLAAYMRESGYTDVAEALFGYAVPSENLSDQELTRWVSARQKENEKEIRESLRGVASDQVENEVEAAMKAVTDQISQKRHEEQDALVTF